MRRAGRERRSCEKRAEEFHILLLNGVNYLRIERKRGAGKQAKVRDLGCESIRKGGGTAGF